MLSLLNLSVDKLGFVINQESTIIESDGLKKVIISVYPMINGVKFTNNDVVVNLYELAILFQRIKMKINSSEVMPYVCSCGDNGCISVFSGLEQSVNPLRVKWKVSKSAIEDNEYDFLPKTEFSFNKNEFLNDIKTLFTNLQKMIDDDKDKVFYEVEALYKLDNAMRLWMGQEPIFKSQEDIIKEAVDSGEYVDPNEVLTLDDIINKTASLIKNKEPSGEDSKKE